MFLFLVVAATMGVLAPQSMAEPATSIVQTSRTVVVAAPNDKQYVEFTLVNNSNQTVIAWEVTFDCRYSDGTSSRSSMTRDGYEVYEGISKAAGFVVPPQSSIRIQSRQPLQTKLGSPCVEVGSAVRWAQLADRSIIGDQDEISFLLEQREREYRAWAFVADALSAALNTSESPVQQALHALNRADQEDFDHTAKKLMRRNLADALKLHEIERQKSNERLRRWLAEAERRAEAAQTHRLR